jgi:hypothetical protein
MGLAETITAAANAAAAIGVQAFPDRCAIKQAASSTPDGFGGTTETPTTIESNLRCLDQPLSRSTKEKGGALITTQNHEIFIEATDNTRLIQPHQTIVIAARLVPERTFRNPVTVDGSFAPIVTIAAELIK